MTSQRLRQFFFCGYFINSSGDWLSAIAISWFVGSELGFGGKGLATVRAAYAIAVMCGTPLAGVALAKLSARSVYFRTSIFLAVCSLALTAIGLLSWRSLAVVVFIRFLTGGGLAFRDPAEQLVIKSFSGATAIAAESRNLLSNTAVRGILHYVNRVMSGLFAGGLLMAFGSPALFSYDAATFIVMAVILSFMKEDQAPLEIRPQPAAAGGEGFIRSLKDPQIRLILALGLLTEGLAFQMWNMLPEVIATRFGGTGLAYGTVIACGGIGGVAGASIMRWLAEKDKQSRLQLGALYVPFVLVMPAALAVAGPSTHVAILTAGYSVALIGWSGFDALNRSFLSLSPLSAWALPCHTFVIRGLCPILQFSLISLLSFLGCSTEQILFICPATAFAILSVLMLASASWRDLCSKLTMLFTSAAPVAAAGTAAPEMPSEE